MAFLTIQNVSIKGVSACVPSRAEENIAYVADGADMKKLIEVTGIERRRVANESTCTSDLCFEAAKKLMDELHWKPEEVEALVFVTQTPDYILPATSPILQQRLGLPISCFTQDISLGCSGYIYGLSTLASYMQSGSIKKGLLLVGDTISKVCSPNDKSTYPLFGDAGTATALIHDASAIEMKFHLASDGAGYKAIKITDGGFRNTYKEASSIPIDIEAGIQRSRMQLELDGMDVFSFGISKAPESVNALLEKFALEKDTIDFFFFHQANKMMNEKIRKKLQLPEHKVPYSLKDFGNTSCATIPLTMVTQTAHALKTGKTNNLACGFGVGLSWGSVTFTTDCIAIPELLNYE